MPLYEGDLERPLVSVVTETHVWRKIGEKHMAKPREPWDEWLGAPLATAFQALWPLGCRTAADRATVAGVSDRVREAALAALAAPLLMKYDYSRYTPSSAASGTGPRRIGDIGRPEPSERLVLPSGARVELRHGKGVWSMRTCYFDDDVAGRDVPLWRRYRQLVTKLRARYLVAPGGPGTSIVSSDRKEDSIETGIEFVSRYNWGLEPGGPPEPWNDFGDPWPQPPPVPAAPPPGLLRPPPPGGGTSS